MGPLWTSPRDAPCVMIVGLPIRAATRTRNGPSSTTCLRFWTLLTPKRKKRTVLLFDVVVVRVHQKQPSIVCATVVRVHKNSGQHWLMLIKFPPLLAAHGLGRAANGVGRPPAASAGPRARSAEPRVGLAELRMGSAELPGCRVSLPLRLVGGIS